MTDILDLPVFPAADIFPRMDDDQLQALAADIKAHGLREPLVIGIVKDKGQLVDGRNRRDACKIAGVAPEFEVLGDDVDLVAYIDSTELRRSVSTGQKAMGYAIRHPEPEKRGRGNKSAASGEFSGVRHQRVSEARAVLKHSRDLAQEVVEGNRFLKEAFTEVQRNQGKVKRERRRRNNLNQARPDLAELVDGEVMSLQEAFEKQTTDAKERKDQEWAATRNMIDAATLIDKDPESARGSAQFYNKAFAESRGEEITPEKLRRMANYLMAYAQAMEELDETPEV